MSLGLCAKEALPIEDAREMLSEELSDIECRGEGYGGGGGVLAVKVVTQDLC